jgi:hypothetical protein
MSLASQGYLICAYHNDLLLSPSSGHIGFETIISTPLLSEFFVFLRLLNVVLLPRNKWSRDIYYVPF